MRARAVPETPSVIGCHTPERPTTEQAMAYLRQRVKASPQSIARFLQLADVETLVQHWSEVRQLQPTPPRRQWTRPAPRAGQPATPRRWARLTADNHVRSNRLALFLQVLPLKPPMSVAAKIPAVNGRGKRSTG